MLHIEKLKETDGEDIFLMLQRIGKNEGEFQNTANGLDFDSYKEWLRTQNDWSRGENLPEGYAAQTIYWLYDNEIPVGIGKIRHKLTPSSKKTGGNIGYAVDPIHRGKGYATILLKELINIAKKMEIPEILITVENYNFASKRVVEKVGGKLISSESNKWYFTF